MAAPKRPVVMNNNILEYETETAELGDPAGSVPKIDDPGVSMVGGVSMLGVVGTIGLGIIGLGLAGGVMLRLQTKMN